jgi:hypothetical protein
MSYHDSSKNWRIDRFWLSSHRSRLDGKAAPQNRTPVDPTTLSWTLKKSCPGATTILVRLAQRKVGQIAYPVAADFPVTERRLRQPARSFMVEGLQT